MPNTPIPNHFRWVPIGDSATRFPNGQPPLIVAGVSYVAAPGGTVDVPGNSSSSPNNPGGWFCLGQTGFTGDRPGLGIGDVGTPFYDQTLTKSIWWDGVHWRDATGASA